MTSELWVLVWAAVLGLVMVLLPPAAAYTRKGYMRWNAGPRDTPFDIGPTSERLKRAFSNFMETFAFFAVVVVALAFTRKSDDISIWGAGIYLAARVIYIPCYVFAIIGIRSLVWLISLFGILMCLYTLLF